MQQEILEKNSSTRLKVYAIWFNMLFTDSRGRWDGAGLTDQRVVHLWDEQKVVGTWYAANVTGSPGVAWDIYFLYDPETTWDDAPPPHVGMGSTIIGRADQLRSSITPLLHPAAGAGLGASG